MGRWDQGNHAVKKAERLERESRALRRLSFAAGLGSAGDLARKVGCDSATAGNWWTGRCGVSERYAERVLLLIGEWRTP